MTPTAPEFRTALARFPSGVTAVTTLDREGRPYGFTASSFCSVSLDPPLVLVCLARTAESYPVFAGCDRFGVSVLRPRHRELARLLATRGADKFGGGWAVPTASGIPVVPDALCVLDCTVHDRYTAGDHIILIGEVRTARVGPGEPLVSYGHALHRLHAGPVSDPDG
ncbi:flavin reductase family protein [Streptacidiphilus sp. P02-A3a]|uniref:flavin reductase family protein n=1 Tax=Streptacidiphilus sp. P02-A3a TaxID=2704468 RepID=UPI001CDB51D0|nr:flavin reductase family protein [Streptacidiphilus sp. P02-A3a]